MYKSKSHIVITLFFIMALLSLQAERKPNILFYLTDDLGYGDVGSYGAKGQSTPAIDQLAKEGTKFSSFYVHQRCSPSRAYNHQNFNIFLNIPVKVSVYFLF